MISQSIIGRFLRFQARSKHVLVHFQRAQDDEEGQKVCRSQYLILLYNIDTNSPVNLRPIFTILGAFESVFSNVPKIVKIGPSLHNQFPSFLLPVVFLVTSDAAPSQCPMSSTGTRVVLLWSGMSFSVPLFLLVSSFSQYSLSWRVLTVLISIRQIDYVSDSFSYKCN